MKFALTQKAMTFALAAVAAFPVIGSGELGLEWAILFPILGFIGWMLEPPFTRRPLFRKIVTAVVIVLLAIQIGRLVRGDAVAILGMEYALALLGIKLCSRGFASDYQQIVILSFLHIIAATIAMDDLSYAVSFLLFVALCPPVLALSYLRKEMENRFGEKSQKEGPEMLERLLRSKRVVSPGFLLGSSFLSVPVLIITAVLFITFPRIGFGLFGRLPENTHMVGFGDSVTLGDFDLLRLDGTVLLRLEPFGFKNQLPPLLPIKIRGAVFDKYEDNSWQKPGAKSWQRLIPKGSDFYLQDRKTITNLNKTPGFDVLLESMDPPLLFLPEGTGMISTNRIATGGRPKTRTLETDPLGAIRYKDNARVGLRYKIYLTGNPPHGDTPDSQSSYLQLPSGMENLRALAREFAKDGSKHEQAENIIQSLQHNYLYSLRLASSEANALAKTPLDRFLFTRRTGTCEHFATALTLMLRAIGIPSRLVTGFSKAEWNPLGKYYAVRQSSAHSWTEAFLDGKWVTLDATPPSHEQTGVSWGESTVAMVIDTLRMRWHKHVVGYDAAAQFHVAMGLWGVWRQVFKTKRQMPIPTWPVWLILAGGAMVGARYWWKRRLPGTTERSKRRPRRRATLKATKLYLMLERRLAKRGFPRPAFRTPEEHVQTLDQGTSQLAEVAREVTRRYNEIRFGGRAFHSGELERLKMRIRDI
ncbi:MAG: DUF3488 domain-containing transglutaminase family protein [Deltaproteobacteria bacterium]|nr:DUF3488 domain-containing transglutaminase family protein [Deltaproteobacteria bacterium]